MGSSCQTTSREAVKSATRSAKKRWLGRHDRPGRRRLRAAAEEEEEEEADAGAPAAVGRWCAVSACAPRRHIGMPAARGGADRRGRAVGRVGCHHSPPHWGAELPAVTWGAPRCGAASAIRSGRVSARARAGAVAEEDEGGGLSWGQASNRRRDGGDGAGESVRPRGEGPSRNTGAEAGGAYTYTRTRGKCIHRRIFIPYDPRQGALLSTGPMASCDESRSTAHSSGKMPNLRTQQSKSVFTLSSRLFLASICAIYTQFCEHKYSIVFLQSRRVLLCM